MKSGGIKGSTSYHRAYEFTSFEELKTKTQLLDNLKAQNNGEHAKNQEWTKIQRVPEVLQRNEDFKDYFKPMELSVGPLHCNDPNLFKAELKLKLAARFIKDSGCTEESLFEEIKSNISQLRTSYDEGEIKTYNDDRLASLFLLDGCAVLQFISSYINPKLNELNINNVQADLIRQDLFLFENQIPFQVLLLLMNMKDQKGPKRVKELGNMERYLIQFLLANSVMEPLDNMLSSSDEWLLNRINGKPAHLLDLLLKALVKDPRAFGKHNHRNSLLQVCDCLCALCCVCNPYRHESYILPIRGYNRNQQQSFRNVQELKAAGITMKRKDSCSLENIRFRRRWCFRARVKLPPLVVDSSTARKMINLVAYEMCRPDYKNYVTSYINLLDLLIDGEEDVKDLRSADILRNRLSSDLEVVQLFNRIGSACLEPPGDEYLEVKRAIENHYKRKRAVWMAQACHTYCSSPWKIMALLVTVAVLVSTAIQTCYAIHPKK